MEVYVNPKDIDMLLDLYKKENKKFVIRSFPKNDIKRRCLCFIDGQECTIDFFIKKDGKVRIMPIGRNVENANKLLEFIKEKTIDANIDSQTCVITCENSVIKQLVEYFKTECKELVEVIINSKNIKFYTLDKDSKIKFTNISGYELPATGSSGMLILLIIGSLLLVVPIIYISVNVLNKKMTMKH